MWRARQFHNQPVDSHLHRFVVDLWDAVRRDTGGRLDVAVHAENADLPGSDPQALDMLVGGELEFLTLMGGLLGRIAPAAELQGLPFAWRDEAHAWRAIEGPLGRYLAGELAAEGVALVPGGCFENGFRQIVTRERPVASVGDLAGLRMRVPNGRMFHEAFEALGAVPVVVNIRDLYAALRDGRVDGQENPLAIAEVNRLYEVAGHVAMTSHMWSGFNLVAHLGFWRTLPDDVRAVVERHTRRCVAAQRAYARGLNRDLETRLRDRGMRFTRPDPAGFRRALAGGFYRRWRADLGARAWDLLEAETGPLD